MRDTILELVKEYSESRDDSDPEAYRASGAVISSDDIVAVVSAAMDGWFTEGKNARDFRAEICRFTGARHSILVNSGSSANLLAVTALKDYYGDKDGDLVITCATAFPTTVAPLIQNRYLPCFIDIDPLTLQYDDEKILSLLDDPNVKGVILAHTLGIPFMERKIANACIERKKWLVADCCDAFGSSIAGKHVGSFADIGTLSFFPAHHITTGEGGAVFTSNSDLFRLMQQYSNWGRDCWCDPGKDNTCNKRFNWSWSQLPKGFDHKYTFTKIGYNLRMGEMQAALGLSQIHRLSSFVEKRRATYNQVFEIMKKYNGLYWWIIPLGVYTSPFGFYIWCNTSEIKRELVQLFENNKISTRSLFAGNITKHPMMKDVPFYSGRLDGSDAVMERAFWIGCWPGVTDENLQKLKDVIQEFVYG